MPITRIYTLHVHSVNVKVQGEYLGSLSANRKRKLGFHDGAKCPRSENACASEIARATAELARLVGSTSFRERAGGYRLGLRKELNSAPSGASYQAGGPRLIAIEVLQGKEHDFVSFFLGSHMDVYSIWQQEESERSRKHLDQAGQNQPEKGCPARMITLPRRYTNKNCRHRAQSHG
jgi:hypothetical protein